MKKIIKLCLSLVLAIVIAFSSTAVFANAANVINKQEITSNSAKSGKYIYYASGNKIRRLNTETRKYKTIENFASGTLIKNLNVKDGWVYFVKSDDKDICICRVKTTGDNYEILAEKANYYVIYGSKIYYTGPYKNDYATCKMSLSGKDKTYVSYYYYRFKIYKNRIYYVHYGLGTTEIISSSLSGKNEKELEQLWDGCFIMDLELYRDRLYYTCAKLNYENFKWEYELNSMSTDGSDFKTHDSTKTLKMGNMKLYSGYVYYNKGNTIYNINLETSKRTLHKSNASLLEKNKEGTYYLDLKDNSIYRRISKTSRACIKKDAVINSPYGYYSLYAYGDHLILNTNNREDEYGSVDVKISYCDKNGKNSRSNIGSYTYEDMHDTNNW